MNFQDYLTTKTKYLKYQQKSRWKFAYNAIICEFIQPRSRPYRREEIVKHRRACREYQSIYYQGLSEKITEIQKERAQVEKNVILLIFN